MNSKKSFSARLYDCRFIIISFLLAALLMTIVYVIKQICPFGENTIMKVDLYHQYGPFHEEFRERVLNGRSLFYSWETGIGKNFVAQMAYYTASPISLLIFLFPQNLMQDAMALFILIKIAFSAAFCCIYLQKTYKKDDMSLIFFSLMYAFMSFQTGFYWNVMWLDAVALFPLVALGVESIVNEGKFKLYAISLALVIFINFYIAFLVCIFAGLYFLVKLFSAYTFKRNLDIIVKRCILFAIFSALAGGMAMILVMPTAITLAETATSETAFPKFKVYISVLHILTNHFIGARPVVLGRNEDLPNIYTGLLTVMLLPYYYLDKSINKRDKVLHSVLLIFMLMCCSLNTFDFVIHGFHFPSNLPHRFTFIYSFILLTMAYKAYLRLREDKKLRIRSMVIMCVIYAIWICVSEYGIVSLNDKLERTLDDLDIAINILAMIGYCIILYFYKTRKNKVSPKPILAILLVCVFAEMLFGAATGLDRTTVRNNYVKYYEPADEAVAYMNENNDKFYRAEFRRFTAINEGSMYHYPGFSHFSSMAPGSTTDLMKYLGVAATINSQRNYDPTPLIESIFDLKYMMNKDATSNNKRYKFIDTYSTTLNDGSTSSVSLYENDKALPLGFMTESEITDWQTEKSYPFAVQNDFVHKAVGIDEDMFTDVDLTDFKVENIRITKAQGDDGEDFDIPEDDPYELGDSKYIDLRYELTNPKDINAIPKVSASAKIDEDAYIFFYVDAGNTKRVKFNINGQGEQDRELSTGRSLFDVGQVKAGDILNINFELTNKGEFEKTYRSPGDIIIHVAKYDEDVFFKAFDKLNSNTLDVPIPENDAVINGTINVAKDGVLFTSIPYDKGWKLTVDGEKYEYIPIGNEGLIGVELPAGEHSLTFKYAPRGFYPGLVVSIISIIVFVVLCIKSAKIKEVLG